MREQHHFWRSRLGETMMTVSGVAVLAGVLSATFGVFMAPIPFWVTMALLLSIAATLIALDFLKVRLFAMAHLHG